MNFKKTIHEYDDEDMILRKKFVANIPYFRTLNQQVISEIMFLMKETSHDQNSTFLKSGDISNRIHVLWIGEISANISYKGKTYKFDTITRGCCLCAYSAFSDDVTQLLDFIVTS